MSTWVIGDIQGCFHSFEKLLGKLCFDPHRDRLWLVGDVVNRGTGSLPMLRWVVAHADIVTAVMGNHELGLLACADGRRKERKTDTIGAILRAPDREELLSWVRELPLLHVEQGNVLVHAGLYPGWDLSMCIARAGNPDDFARDVFTRMRLVRDDLSLDLKFAGAPEDAPDGGRPWFEMRVFEAGFRVLFGHWAALGARSGTHWQSLDDACVWGGSLTAMDLESGVLVRVAVDPRDLPNRNIET